MALQMTYLPPFRSEVEALSVFVLVSCVVLRPSGAFLLLGGASVAAPASDWTDAPPTALRSCFLLFPPPQHGLRMCMWASQLPTQVDLPPGLAKRLALITRRHRTLLVFTTTLVLRKG